MSEVSAIDIRLPERGSSQGFGGSSYGRKPMATAVIQRDDGVEKTISIPVRVARVLLKDDRIDRLPLSEDEVFTRIRTVEERVCFTMLAEMLSRRDHGSEEAREKLKAFGFLGDDIDRAIDRATELRFLNDDRFVASFIEERKRRGWGKRKIELELRRKGVDVRSISGYPERFFDEEDDEARARALLERKRVPDSRAYEKLVRFLLSKGFDYGISSACVKEHLRQQ